jgi:pantetheine-phosphate adenylyltransferase
MKRLKSAVYPGSFDPIHSGHINVIKRACKLFDILYVAVSFNIDKQNQTPITMRTQRVKKIISKLKLKNVKVVVNKALTVGVLKQLKCNCIIRSLRDTQDFNYEMRSARINNYLDHNIETICFFADDKLKQISSRDIRESQRQIKLLKVHQ